MNFIGWIRDLFGIQKDMYETKKTRLEIEKLEKEGLGGGGGHIHITRPTMEDIHKYDPKVEAIRRQSKRYDERMEKRQRDARKVASKSGGCLVSSFIVLLLSLICLFFLW